MEPTSRFVDILGDFPEETQAAIEDVVPAKYKTSAQLRVVVRGMNRVEATALLQRNFPDLTELDASALAGVLLASSAPAQATAAPPVVYVPPTAELFYRVYDLSGVSGCDHSSSLILKTIGGFRKFIKEQADRIGVRGSIQRQRIVRVEVKVFGEKGQHGAFVEVLDYCRRLELIEQYTVHVDPMPVVDVGHDFVILRSESRFANKGPYSDAEYDGKSTTSSMDQELRSNRAF